MSIPTATVKAALDNAGIGCRVWLAGGGAGQTNHRVYITDAGLESLGIRAANQRRKHSGAYVECATDEALVQDLGDRTAEPALIAILQAAGISAR